MIPLTVAETARLLAAQLTRPALPGHALPGHALPGHALPGHAVHWLTWRRRHQARARWYRQRPRLTANAG